MKNTVTYICLCLNSTCTMKNRVYISYTTSRFWLAIPIKKITPSEKTCIQSCRSYFYNEKIFWNITTIYYLMKNAIYTSEKNWNRLIMIIFLKNNILKKTACIGKKISVATFEIYFSCFFFFKLSNLFFLTFFIFWLSVRFISIVKFLTNLYYVSFIVK